MAYQSTNPDIIKMIYDKLQDDESRLIFDHRLRYYQTGDVTYLLNMLSELDNVYDNYTHVPESRKNRLSALKKRLAYEKRDIVMYGAGGALNGVLFLLNKHIGVEPVCICDSDSKKWDTKKDGLNIISPHELQQKHKDSYIVISGINYNDKIFNDLLTLGYSPDNIFTCCSPTALYFRLDEIPAYKNEIYIDAGCYDGQTIIDFIKYCPDYDHIYGLEPDPTNFVLTKEKITSKDTRGVTLINKGVWSSEKQLHLAQSGSRSMINETGEITINTTTIDYITRNDSVSFIKMDIEGAEAEAIKGAKDTIMKHKPKLAVCLYHKPEDILEIPLLIHDLVPEYKFYIRHHSLMFVETVLYAVK
jgi:FkbM family methyltransferase